MSRNKKYNKQNNYPVKKSAKDVVQSVLNEFTEILEFIINIIVLVAIVIALISLWEPLVEFIQHRAVEESLMVFIERVFDVVIAIEFKKMLGKPDTSTIMEILVFVIVRHMIITDTSAMENFLTIVSVGVIFAIKKYLHEDDESNSNKAKNKSNNCIESKKKPNHDKKGNNAPNVNDKGKKKNK